MVTDRLYCHRDSYTVFPAKWSWSTPRYCWKKTVAGINDGNKEVVVVFTIYGTNSSIENWEELFGNDTSISNDSEILLMESYDEIQYKMAVGYKEYIVSKEDFNRVKLYEIIRYVPDGDHMSIREVVHSPDWPIRNHD